MIGRWGSVDPLAEKYTLISPYAYVADNPLRYIDEDGREIIVPQRDRAQVTKYINSISSGKFAINAKGHLYMVSSKGGGGSSKYFTERLIEGIKSEIPIAVTIAKKYTSDGNTYDVNKDAGGGVTTTKYKTTVDKDGNVVKTIASEHVTISGDSNPNILDTKFKTLRDNPADILVHELVGHAIPIATKPYAPNTGNAIDNENKVRKEEGKGKNKQRDTNLLHYEQ